MSEKGDKMYSIEIHIQSPGRCCEVFSEDVNSIELLVETVVSQAMLELFETVLVQDVIVSFLPLDHECDAIVVRF